MAAAAPPPITGIAIDPPPTEIPAYAEAIDERSEVGGILLRAKTRYSYANVGLLASGTAYYLILTLFSLMAFAYGVTAVLGADALAQRITESVSEALPGLIGDDGIDPATLRSTGQTAGVIGLLVLLYGSLGAVGGASKSMHLIFGAPPDPRSFVKAKVRFLLFLVIIAPLVAITFASVGLTSDLVGPLLDAIGLGTGFIRTLVTTGGFVLGYAVDLLILWILIGHLGGIRPHPRPRLIGAAIGAVAVFFIKLLLDAIVNWAVDKPEYGAFAAPLAALFVMSLLSQVLYGTAALTAGISDREVPLEELEATPEDAVEDTPDPDGLPDAGEDSAGSQTAASSARPDPDD